LPSGSMRRPMSAKVRNAIEFDSGQSRRPLEAEVVA
jgi:hypothetical protein